MRGGFVSRKAALGIFLVVLTSTLAWDYWNAEWAESGSALRPANKNRSDKLAPLPKPTLVNKSFSQLVVDGHTYVDVTISSMTPNSIGIIHRDGSATLPLAGAPEEVRKELGYDPTKALAYEELKNAHEKSARQLHRPREAIAAKPASEQKRKPIIVVLAQSSMSWLEGFFAKPPDPEPAPTPDPKMVRNRQEVIRFYERVIEDLERQDGQSGVASVRRQAGTLLAPSKESLKVWSRSSATGARQKQIQEYRTRIAKLKEEIGQ